MNSEKIKLISNSDKYWEKYWAKIDKAQKSIFIVTYDLDNKMIANLTLRKLIQAAERGVQVVLLVEHLNFYMKHSLSKELKNIGGIIIKPNPLHKIFSHFYNSNFKKFFNRCHQKVSLIDNDLFLGSLNIAEEYSNIKYGSFDFIDLNIYVKNTICRNKVLYFFKELIEQNKDQVNDQKQERLNSIFKDYSLDDDGIVTPNYNNYEEFLEEYPPKRSEIQDNIYDLLASSEESITIIQPYYNNLKKIEDLLIRAVKRGVKVKIITAEKRDQPAYKYLYNTELFGHLLKNGVEVYEFLDKFFHAKAYYVDHKYLNMGSLNNDRTSFIMNNEANYFLRRNKGNENVFKDFEEMLTDLHENSRLINIKIEKMNPFRLAYCYWWYFFMWSMEQTVPSRKVKYDK